MEDGGMKHVNEQSYVEVPIKTEIEEKTQPAEYNEIEVNLNWYKEELEMGQAAFPEITLPVKEEILDDSLKDLDNQRSNVPAIIGSVNPSPDIQCNIYNIKEELGNTELDFKPSLHINYTSNQQKASGGTEECTTSDDGNNPTPSNRGKETSVEDKSRRSNSQLHRCDQCLKTFNSKASLSDHCRRVHRKESHKCTKCNKEYKCKAYLQTHISHIHSKKQYECAVCKTMCKSKRALGSHFARRHKRKSAVPSSVDYTCDYCQKTYPRRQSLVRHIRVVHGKIVHRCSECNMDFKGKRYLQNHIRTLHSKEKYECEFCKKIFRTKQYYNRHVRVMHRKKSADKSEHSESRQKYTCSNCGKGFKSKWNYKQHEGSAKCIRPTVGDLLAVDGKSTQQQHVVVLKEGPADGALELGPVVFQHVDFNYPPCNIEEPQLG